MASSSLTSNPLLGVQVTEKLTRQNHTMWSAQVLATLRGARLERYVNGKAVALAAEVEEKKAGGKTIMASNPAYEEWFAADQQVLGFLLSSLSRDILAQVAISRTSAEAWKAISDMFASHTRARTTNVRLALATTKKENMSVAQYYSKMKGLADEMAAAGKPLDDEELVMYICNGLDLEFNPLVFALVTRIEPVTPTELYSQLLSFETRLKLRLGTGSSSANTARRGGRGGNQQMRGSGRGGRGRSSFGQGSGGRSSGGRGQQQQSRHNQQNQSRRNFPIRPTATHDSNGRPICQVCFKTGHTALECWHRFDENYVPEERHVAAVMSLYSMDQNWYMDTGATNNITSDLEKLVIRDKYNGGDQIHTASGAGMEIKHIGHPIVHTPTHDLHLNNILHVPKAAKNLVSVHRLTKDNSIFLEFHPNYFLIKDQITKNIILRGACRRGLYPLPPSSTIKQAFGVVKPSFERWHSRLGHASAPIVSKVISMNNLPCLGESNKESVCDTCQKAKSHQLPYPKFHSVSSQPLQLIFLDVWEPSSFCVGRNKYYVSFIDDYSKFVWLYPLKHKSEVF